MVLNSIFINKLKTIISYILAIITIIVFIAFVALRQTSDFSFAPFIDFKSLIYKGILNTILISIISLLGSMILGFILYLLQIS